MIEGSSVTLYLEVGKGHMAMFLKVKSLEAISRQKLHC